MSDFSFIANAHPSYIESMYEKYQEDPNQVDEGWRNFFLGFEFSGKSIPTSSNATSREISTKELNLLLLITAYRNRGHLKSDTNPIRTRQDRQPYLEKEDYGLTDDDLNTVFAAGNKIKGLNNPTLKEILAHLNKVYCGHIGFEYHFIKDREERLWIRKQIETYQSDKAYGLGLDKKKRILKKLKEAVVFEEFLGIKYLGQKRFSLEGGESAIVALDGIINFGAERGIEEVIIGMAHRGRLNVLANILGKTYDMVFSEFEGDEIPSVNSGDGDVKYHLGFTAQVDTTGGKKVHIELMPNPSHLESVDPVVEGFTRAKANMLYEDDYNKILPVLIHGDAALAGLGIGYETIQMSRLEAYETGGTVHIVINNQIGFTTNFTEARSSDYCTAIANGVNSPIFHVNGDDPEAVLYVTQLAIAYRQKFHKDVFVDIVCYRKHGHNEADDPSFTQPEMTELIKVHKNPMDIYAELLINRGDISRLEIDNMEMEFKNFLQDRLDKVRQKELEYQPQKPEKEWQGLTFTMDHNDFRVSPKTGISKKNRDLIIQQLMTLPAGFNASKKIDRLLKGKQKLLDRGQLDWAMGELLAYGSILMEGKDIRFTGEDVLRGTFSHRHAVLRDTVTYEKYNRLADFHPGQGKFHIYNSLLNEFGVMGYEYGYAMVSPSPLVIWEAQFGDFFNGAQTIVDQYLSAAESKWGRMNGLVLYLPHGMEGMGPEHSSARPERFLQSCAEFNMTVANITTPANLFHILRRQLARPFRKPLVIMTPKSLLRHPEVISPLDAFTTGTSFREIYDDATTKSAAQSKKVKRVLMCTGKVYYDLLAKKRELGTPYVAIIRLEQLYPFPLIQMEEVREKYMNAEYYWVQEEPSNMGAWQYVHAFRKEEEFTLIARKSSASPATGFKKAHQKQQKDLVERAFSGLK